MRGLFNKLESKLGIDLNGDGHIGGAKPAAAAYQQPPMPGYNPQPSGNGYPQQNQSGYGYPPQHSGYGYPPQQTGYGNHPQQNQSYSGGAQYNGRKKALLIGINYKGQQGELRGCINDVRMVRRFLLQQGFPAENMAVLVDDPAFASQEGCQVQNPTRAVIEGAFRWLSSNNSPGDCLFLHYSGHGSQVKDTNGDEADGMDETIIPVDYKSAGQIVDDDIFKMVIAPLPAGVRLTAVMDCCHSGTALDLPYIFVGSKQNLAPFFTSDGQVNPQALQQLGSMIMSTKWDAKNWKTQAFGLGMQYLQGMGGGGSANGYEQNNKNQIAAEVIAFSGCQDKQTSADVGNVQASFGASHLPPATGPGVAGGAMSNALISVLAQHPKLSLIELLAKMREVLKAKGFQQVPELSSSHQLDFARPFSLTA